MVANINPIYVKGAKQAWSSVITAADTTQTGITGANYFADSVTGFALVAGADGIWLPGVRFKSRGTNVASLARVFINNGSAETSASNNLFFEEIVLPATTLSQAAAQQPVFMPINMIIPSGHRLFWTLATAVAGGWQGMFTSGDY
jgi:hypothetical protein